jgi:hypothetical protein
MKTLVSALMGAVFCLALIVCANIDTKALAQTVAEALGISYDNSQSGLAANNVQEAIDQLAPPAVPFGKWCQFHSTEENPAYPAFELLDGGTDIDIIVQVGEAFSEQYSAHQYGNRIIGTYLPGNPRPAIVSILRDGLVLWNDMYVMKPCP